jgi:thymidylate kinase
MYIALEGPDASGKNAVAEYLKQHWYKPDITPILTGEPYLPTKAHAQIEKRIKDESPAIQQRWYEYLRELHREHILVPAIRNHQDIIHVRTFLSTAVYQLFLQTRNRLTLRDYINQSLSQRPLPKRIFILDTTYQVAQSRKPIEYDETAYERLREGYDAAHRYLRHIEMTHIIDTTHKTVEEVGEEILDHLRNRK